MRAARDADGAYLPCQSHDRRRLLDVHGGTNESMNERTWSFDHTLAPHILYGSLGRCPPLSTDLSALLPLRLFGQAFVVAISLALLSSLLILPALYAPFLKRTAAKARGESE